MIDGSLLEKRNRVGQVLIELTSSSFISLCLALVEPKAPCYRANVCVRNHPSVNTSEPKEAKVSHSNRKTLNITLPDVLVNKIQNYDLEAESWMGTSGNIFFELFLSDLDEKMISSGYERHKNKNRNKLIFIVPSARRAQGTMLSCILNCASVTRVFLVFFRQQPQTTFEQCSFHFRIPRTHDVDGSFLLRSLNVLTWENENHSARKKIGPQCILVWDFIQVWYGLNKWDNCFVLLLFNPFCAVRYYIYMICVVNFEKGKAKI